MDLLFTSKEELTGDVMISGNVGWGDHEMVEFEIQRGARNETEEHRRAAFRLFRELIGGITASLKRRSSWRLSGL